MAQQSEVVHLDVPATSGRLRLVRLAVVGLATEYGADVDDLEDVRIATGEICTHLVNRADDGDRLVVEISVTPDGDSEESVVVAVTAKVADRGHPGEFDDLSDLVLTTTATTHGVGADGADSASWFRRQLRPVTDSFASTEGGPENDG
jgi:anti-sigma regulatory factor (Ser/Thr protein kinase)